MKVGDKIRDNDPRMGQRTLTVTMVMDSGRVYARDRGNRVVSIMGRRIFTDGKPRRSGFSLITAPPQP